MGDTDPLFETGGYGTPGSALALDSHALCPIARTELSVPGDGLPVVTLPDCRLALARRLPRRSCDLVLAALLPIASDRPAGWKLDFFDYLAEKLRAL